MVFFLEGRIISFHGGVIWVGVRELKPWRWRSNYLTRHSLLSNHLWLLSLHQTCRVCVKWLIVGLSFPLPQWLCFKKYPPKGSWQNISLNRYWPPLINLGASSQDEVTVHVLILGKTSKNESPVINILEICSPSSVFLLRQCCQLWEFFSYTFVPTHTEVSPSFVSTTTAMLTMP